MSWEAAGAIGEILGSIGVLVTLIYFGVQLRKTQVMLEVESLGATQQSTFDLNTQIIQHAELIQKANSSEKLTPAEDMQIRAILFNMENHSFFTFIRTRKLGQEIDQPMKAFASFLNENSALRILWLDERFSSSNEGPNRLAWKAAVEKHIEN